jgi:pilus assembly protein CpaE
VSSDITIIGSQTKELEALFRSIGITAGSGHAPDLLNFAQPGARPPRVVVVDIRQHGELPPSLALLKKEHPSTGVVIVAAKLDPAVMLVAMRAGVTEWVTDPVDAKDLAAAIERAAGAKPVSTTGELYAIVGAKGGVGATTLAVNVATTLSSMGQGRTLLIEMHRTGGDAAVFLGAEPSFSMLDALDNTHRLDEAFLKGLVVKTAAGPDLLAAPERSSAASIDPRRVRGVVEFAMRCYRFVVLDVCRSDALVDETLGLATSITVVTTQELAAIKSAGRSAEVLRERHGAARVQVVVNRYDPSAEIAAEDLARAVGGRVGHLFPSNYRLAIHALNQGRPLVVDNHNKLASSFAAYARSLSGVEQADASTARSTGFLGRLTGRRN